MSNRSQSTRGAFGKPTTKRALSVGKLSAMATQMYQTMQQQQSCIQEYYASLSQMTEMLEANDSSGEMVPQWMVQKARTLIDSTQQVE